MQGRRGDVGAAGQSARGRCRSFDLGGAAGGNPVFLAKCPAPCLGRLRCRELSAAPPERSHEQLVERGPDPKDRRLNGGERGARLGIFAPVRCVERRRCKRLGDQPADAAQVRQLKSDPLDPEPRLRGLDLRAREFRRVPS
jgi:hypothetical protein